MSQYMFKEGDIVKIKYDRKDKCSKGQIQNCIGKVLSKNSRSLRFFVVVFTNSITCADSHCYCCRNIYLFKAYSLAKATKREEFLYRVYGSECLKNIGDKK